SAANPTFIADQPGTYVAQLMVNNGLLDSAPATVTITTAKTAPVARAGRNQNVTAGATVQLDGSASFANQNRVLTYNWSLLNRPSGSNATLSGANTVAPAFVADVPGTYVAQLIVNDGQANSDPVTVTSTVNGPQGITFTPDPLTLTPLASGTFTLHLPSPAGSGGQIVNLSSSDVNVASVPASVTVPQNSTT